jgi:hypothetical protein
LQDLHRKTEKGDLLEKISRRQREDRGEAGQPERHETRKVLGTTPEKGREATKEKYPDIHRFIVEAEMVFGRVTGKVIKK